jgi:hypothetical protein
MTEQAMTVKHKIGLVLAGLLIGFLIFWIANVRVPSLRFPGAPSSVSEDFGMIFVGFLFGIGFHFAGWLVAKILA